MDVVIGVSGKIRGNLSALSRQLRQLAVLRLRLMAMNLLEHPLPSKALFLVGPICPMNLEQTGRGLR